VIDRLDVNALGDRQPQSTEQISPQLYKFFQQILEHVVKHPEFQSAIPDPGILDEVMMEVLVNGVRYTLHHSASPLSASHASLSPREREIVRLVARGLPTKAIAATLEVSPWTVCTHLRRIFSKLGVKSRAEMVARALEDNLLEAIKV
jgi:DNA-binding CsgD family transcriptional regulator